MLKCAAALIVGAATAGSLLGMPPTASGQPGCAVDITAPQVVSAIKSQNASLQQAFGWDWDTDTTYVDGNYSPCAALSVAVTSVEGATGSSPDLAVLFHDGQFVGPATPKFYPFVAFNSAQSTNDTVVLDFKDPNSCSACEGNTTSVRFQWRNDHVEALDPLPSTG